jgi:hypothetical protein
LGDFPLPVIHRPSIDPSVTARARSHYWRPVVAAILIGLLAVSAALASTPVTNGYRDQSYGGGAFRPTGDKPQSKLWFTDGTWFAGMFVYRASGPAISEFRIHRLDEVAHAWVDTGVVLDTRDKTHGDYLWDETAQTLWVASAYTPTAGVIDDANKVFKYTYNAGSNTYTPVAGYPKTIPDTASATGFAGGAVTLTLARDTTGRVWAVWPKTDKVLYSTSTDGGDTWSTPAQVPVQTNTIRSDANNQDTAGVVTFGSNVGIMWSDHDALPSPSVDGFYFAVIAAGADPTVAPNWNLEELPTLIVGADPREVADDHINMKTTSDGQVYMVGKTGKDTAACATNKQLPLIEVFKRTAAGVWSAHLVSTVGDCNTRPQLILSEELDVAYVVMTAPNGAGTIYLKSAPLTGPQALLFRGTADQTIQRGTPFIRSATETASDDPSTMKQNVTAASGIVVLANNIFTSSPPNSKFYMHNEMSIAAVDSTPPAGTAVIDAGATFAGTTAVSVSVPATDAGSGVSLVRVSNAATVSGGVLTTGTSFSYTSPVPWTMTAGDGIKTVYVQWRDAAGNWSAVTSDTITLDTTAPTGTVSINGGAAATNSVDVTLSLTASDGTGSGVTSVLLSNSTDFTGATPIPFAASVPWTLTAGDGAKTVYAKFVDAVGNTTVDPVTDAITLDTVAPAPGAVAIENGAAVIGTRNVTVNVSGVAGDATAARAANTADMAGALSVSPTGSFAWTLTAGADGPRTVYVQWSDAAGNWSTAASDDIVLDTVPPTGTVVVNAGKAWTKTTAVSLTFPNTDGDTTQVRVGSASNLAGATYQTYTAGMTLAFTLPAGNGQKTVYAQFKDVGGSVSTIVSDTIGLDTTVPTAPTAPVHLLSNPVANKINVRLTWSGGTDLGGSGFAGYVLRQRIDGGAWTILGYPTTGSANVPIDPAKNYVFGVASRDGAGNVGTYVTGPSLRAANHSETSTAIAYTGTWATQSLSTYMGGAAKYSNNKSAAATFTFTGNQVAWLSRKSTAHGTANVYVDGTLVGSVNLYSATTQYKQVVFTRTFASVGTHTLKVVVVGTAGHPRVAVDQFFVLR